MSDNQDSWLKTGLFQQFFTAFPGNLPGDFVTQNIRLCITVFCNITRKAFQRSAADIDRFDRRIMGSSAVTFQLHVQITFHRLRCIIHFHFLKTSLLSIQMIQESLAYRTMRMYHGKLLSGIAFQLRQCDTDRVKYRNNR